MAQIELEYETMDAVPAEYKDLYTEKDGRAVLTGVKGMKTDADVNQVKEGLRKEREDHKATKELLKKWGDRKPDETLAALDKLEELELLAEGKVDETKIETLVEKRLKQKTAPLERQIAEIIKERDEAAKAKEELQGTLYKRDMLDEVRREATNAKVLPGAMADIEIIAPHLLERTDDGKVITREVNGLTPGLTVNEFFKEMQKTRAHWWPESEGGGSRGGIGGGGYTGDNPFSHDKWNLTQQGVIIREKGAEFAEKLAKAAGTTVGGLRPSAPK